GVLLTAFYLIPSFGISSILIGAGILNIAIGVAAFVLHSRQEVCDDMTCELPESVEAPVETDGGEQNASLENVSGGFMSLLIWGFALSGFTGLVYEVIWTRILGFLLVGTVYAFASVLAVFLVGIALGSLVFSSFIDRFSRSTIITLFAVVETLIGLCSIALIIVYNGIPGYEFYETLQHTPVWSEWLYAHFFMAFITLIVPTFLFGATFPLVCKVYSWRVEGVGTKIGNIYAVNTVGGIIGSFAAGFILIPLLGMQNVIIVVGCINILLGIAFILANPFSQKGAKYAFTLASIVIAAVIIALLPANMPLSLHQSFLQEGEKTIYYKEGPAATVMIGENKSMLEIFNKKIWVNGSKATASYYEGLQINRFQGVLPMVLHPNPTEVLVICFGSGTTFGTLSQFPGVMVDNVEISKSVIGGAHNFKRENMDVLNNPQSRINIDDGRSFLATTKQKFDVITEEPMHPSLAGVINLYTTEYYELAKSHLKPGGIISQWIPLYNLSVEDVQMLTATFQSVFPHTTIWIANADI
ncbi:MAG: fused MFS/spermidine synthase, partial [Proteobacteria bacterium]|nr:fused MFS/spermidine synthase [Pseudomonadota bacterium]